MNPDNYQIIVLPDGSVEFYDSNGEFLFYERIVDSLTVLSTDAGRLDVTEK